MEHEELPQPNPEGPIAEGPGTPEQPAPKIQSEEALARSKEEVTTFFKEPKAPKKPGRWTAGRTVRNRPSK